MTSTDRGPQVENHWARANIRSSVLRHLSFKNSASHLNTCRHWICWNCVNVKQTATTQARNPGGGQNTAGKFIGHSLQLLEIVLKNWSTSENSAAPPGVPSWLHACFHPKRKSRWIWWWSQWRSKGGAGGRGPRAAFFGGWHFAD